MVARLVTAFLFFAVLCSATDSRGSEVRWKMASSFAGNLIILGELGHRLEELVARESGGEMEIQFFQPGALVGPLEIFDAVSEGSIDAGWSASGYWAGKIPALQFFTSAPFGPSPEAHMEWMWEGGGYELMNHIYARHNIRSIPCAMVTAEGFGWFREELRNVEDLKGLKMRFFGLGAKVMEKLGVSTLLLAGGDIFPSLETGTIDATEFSTPYIDLDLGFYQVAKYYYYPGWHQPAGMLDLMINLDRWKGLSPTQQTLLVEVCKNNISYGLEKQENLVPSALAELERKRAKVQETPNSIIEAARSAWFEVVVEEANADAEFGAVYVAQQTFFGEAEKQHVVQIASLLLQNEEYQLYLSAAERQIAEEKRLAEEAQIAKISEQRETQALLQALLTKAEKGSAEAQYQLAERYYYGNEVDADNSKALTWYTKAAEQDHPEAQYTLALFYKNGEVVSRDASIALSWARKAHLNGSAAAGEMYSELLLEDFVYGNDVEALKNLADYIEVNCKSDIKCAFDRIWSHIDLTGDGNLSLAEIARFQRILVKLAAVEQEQVELEVGEIVGINIASILLLPITASSIVHSFDYDNDGLLSPNEVLGDTAFAKLVGIDAENLAAGIDFEGLGDLLRESLALVPFFE